MNYRITYECRFAGQVFEDSFELESNNTPTKSDVNVIDAALKASVKFSQGDIAGVEILEISQRRIGE